MNDMTDFNDLHKFAGPDAVKECIDSAIESRFTPNGETATACSLDTWPAPMDVKTDLPPAPQFDAKALLPPTLADFVLDEADRMPCSPDYIAAALIVCLGSVIGALVGDNYFVRSARIVDTDQRTLRHQAQTPGRLDRDA